MENKDENILLEIKPKFNLIYEIFMPTGRKIKNSILFVIVSLIFIILIFYFEEYLSTLQFNISNSLNLLSIIKWMFMIILIASILKLIFNIVIQKMQYNSISYKFYNTHMIYEDTFLNQHKKNIDYSNIREIEIRKTVLDRILGFGVIIIYTNAENKRNNGLVVYGIDNPSKIYEKINEIVNLNKMQQSELNNQIN